MMVISGNPAFDAGFAARQRGVSRDSNPYPAGSEDHASWFSAWDWLDEHKRDRRAALVEEGLGELIGGDPPMTARTPAEIAERIVREIERTHGSTTMHPAQHDAALIDRIAAAIAAEQAAVDTLQIELATMIGAHAEANYKAQTAEHERDEARAESARLREALERQADNMAFVLNHGPLPDQLYKKFARELKADRIVLSGTKRSS